PASEAERIYYAALLLSVGQVVDCETELAKLSPGGESNRTQQLAAALRKLISAVKRQSNASPVDHHLSSSLLAASYYEQSLGHGDQSLQAALSFAREAAANSPDFSFAWARVAELEFSFGHTSQAIE